MLKIEYSPEPGITNITIGGVSLCINQSFQLSTGGKWWSPLEVPTWGFSDASDSSVVVADEFSLFLTLDVTQKLVTGHVILSSSAVVAKHHPTLGDVKSSPARWRHIRTTK